MWHAIQAALKQIDKGRESDSLTTPHSIAIACSVGVTELMRSYGEQKPLPFLELEAAKNPPSVVDYRCLASLRFELKALRQELLELRKLIDSQRI